MTERSPGSEVGVLRRPRGHTLVWFIDGVEKDNIRVLLRKPKRDAPGWSHALHNLFSAYTELESQHLDLIEKVRRAKADLT